MTTIYTRDGQQINWFKPPKPTDIVRWSKKTTGGKPITGLFRTIAHLDYLYHEAMRVFSKPLRVIQPPFNTGVPASAGTHDYDACWDGYISGVPWLTQQAFFRQRGLACWYRKPPAFSDHIHGFPLPPRIGTNVSDDFDLGGFKVGKYVDGGWSTVGDRKFSSQIEDYYEHKTGLAGHANDPTWFPPSIEATIFDLPAYIRSKRQENAVPAKDVFGVAWNAKVKRDPKKVQQEFTNLRVNNDPEFIAAQEVEGYRGALKKALPNYHIKQPRPKGRKPKGVQVRDAGSTALAIRRNVPIAEQGVLRVDAPWYGPNDLLHEGRTFPWAVIPVQDRWTLVMSIHMSTGARSQRKENRKAWNEIIEAIETLAKAKGYPVLLVGDWNWPWGEGGDRSPAALAERLGAKIKHTNLPIDYVIATRPIPASRTKIKRGAKRGSDHFPIRLIRKK